MCIARTAMISINIWPLLVEGFYTKHDKEKQCKKKKTTFLKIVRQSTYSGLQVRTSKQFNKVQYEREIQITVTITEEKMIIQITCYNKGTAVHFHDYKEQ